MKTIVTKKTRKTAKARAMAITTTIAGIVTYRTRKPLTEAKANAFARLVAANPRFLDSTVVRSKKVNHFHVCFLPASIARIEIMLTAEDNKDVAAQKRDGRRFVYSELSNKPGVFSCAGITGNYETTLNYSCSCTCPQYKYRRNSYGGECKHIKELRARKEAGLLQPVEVAVKTPTFVPAAPLPMPVPANVPVYAHTLGGYGSDKFRAAVSADFD